MSPFFTMLCMLGVIFSFFCVGISVIYSDDDDYILCGLLFTCHILVLEKLDDLNTAGKAIVLFFVTIFLLPSDIILLIAFLLLQAIDGIWKLYKFVFRKRGCDDD